MYQRHPATVRGVPIAVDDILKLMEYRHTQQAILPFAAWLGLLIFLGVVIPREEWTPWIGAFIALITVVMIVFSRLTVRVNNDAITTAFGFGWPKHTERVSDIGAAREVRNKWIHGWGIRKVPNGWMYNVSGYDAVELDLASGKNFRIGTDEPDTLAATITLILPPRGAQHGGTR